jgi:NAD(P)-dependent dehydrogenase (short-subunit alcohol dehydrogenase family)
MSSVFDPDVYTKAECITKSYFRDVYPAVDPSNTELSQAGKVVIVTGAARGLGVVSSYRSALNGECEFSNSWIKAIALAHAQAGARGLLLAGRSIPGLQVTKELILKESPAIDIFCVATDISDEESVANLYAELKSHFGTAETLINNAGVLTMYGSRAN